MISSSGHCDSSESAFHSCELFTAAVELGTGQPESTDSELPLAVPEVAFTKLSLTARNSEARVTG